MGKAMRLKGDLDDVEALLEIISVLRDVSTNRFYQFSQRKTNYTSFLEAFLDYFGMIGNVDTKCPLVKNDNPNVDLLVIASDLGFMSQLNGRVGSAAFKEYQKYPRINAICLGKRASDKMKGLGMQFEKIFTLNEIPDRYEMALQIREYLVGRMLRGESGKAIVVYLWAKTFSILKPRVVTLLPASELLAGEEEDAEGTVQAREGGSSPVKKEKFILESSIDHLMRGLADIWVHSRLYEMINDLQLVEFAAQSQQLESAIEGLSSEKKALTVSVRKATREELNKAIREVFTQVAMMKRR